MSASPRDDRLLLVHDRWREDRPDVRVLYYARSCANPDVKFLLLKAWPERALEMLGEIDADAGDAELKTAADTAQPAQGELYRHHRNGRDYVVLAVAPHAFEWGARYVVYQALYDDPEFGYRCIWARRLSDFQGLVATDDAQFPVRRFTRQ